ncbi:MAG: hypothetical protein ABEJ88_06380 [Halobacterium sp.]
MPERSSKLKHALRGFGVWFAWFLLTGYVTHDRTYGDLKRIERKQLAKRLVPMTVSVVALGWLATQMPPGAAAWVGSGLLLGGGFGGLVVGGYLAITWYADYSLSR